MKYTPERADKLIQLVLIGMPITHACAVVGISSPTFYEWRKKHSEFNSRAESAESEFMARNLAALEKAARGTLKTDENGKATGKPGDPKVVMWLLEKRFPKEFGHLARLQLEGEVKANIELSNEQLTDKAARLLERKQNKNGLKNGKKNGKKKTNGD